MGSPGWRALSTEETLAVQAELELLHARYGSDYALADWLGCSQQMVYLARAKGRIGPRVATALYEFLGASRDLLLAKHRAILPKPPKTATPKVELDLPPDSFHAREIAARRAALSTQWNITPSAIRYVCTAPEWQSPKFGTRDAVFWIEQMKLQTLDEARAKPETEEERVFQEMVRAAHEKRAKERRRTERAAAKEAAKTAERPAERAAVRPRKAAG